MLVESMSEQTAVQSFGDLKWLEAPDIMTSVDICKLIPGVFKLGWRSIQHKELYHLDCDVQRRVFILWLKVYSITF